MTGTIIPQKIVDSLLNIKFRVGMYLLMENKLDQTGLKKLPEDFAKLVKDNSTEESKYLNGINGISSQKNHKIILADTVKLKQSYSFEDIDLLFRFSRILYTENKRKAVFELGGLFNTLLFGKA